MLFIQAVQNGDLAEVDRLLKLDPKLAHGRKHAGMSSSHTALQRALGQPRIFARILAEHPDVNETSSDNATALQMAVVRQLLPDVKSLIQHGADTDAMDNEGNTPLHAAVELDQTGQFSKLLLDAGADPNQVSPANPKYAWLDGKSPFHRAAESGNEIAVTHMLNAGAQVNGRDAKGRTALHLAAQRDQSHVAKLLVEHGADLLAKDDQGLIPGERGDRPDSSVGALIWWEKIAQLLEQQQFALLDEMLAAAPQALSFRSGSTPETLLHRAVQTRQLKVLEYLLSRHADPNITGQQGQTPLHDACWTPIPVDFARRLIEAGADIESMDESGQTPLHAAARGHNHDVIQLLISTGANLDALDNGGTTVLDATFLRYFRSEDGHKSLTIIRDAGHRATVLFAAATGGPIRCD
jgi:ankyrin repeat protein